VIIRLNNFVYRQKADSRFGHTTWTEPEILAALRENFDLRKPGYRDGVVLVPVSPVGWFCSTIEMWSGMPLKATYEPRREGEAPRLHVGYDVGETGCGAAKQAAVACDIVLYASTVLAADGSNDLPAIKGNWEAVCYLPRLHLEDEPIRPEVLMANHYEDDGGTPTNMTDSQFVEALRESRAYWNTRIMLG